MKWLYYVIPIIVHIFCLPFWFIEKNPGNTAIFEMILGMLIIPMYLIIISFKYITIFNLGNFFKMLFLMIGIVVLGNLIFYFNWGISTGKLLAPDSETILILKYQMIISSCILLVGWIIIFLIKSKCDFEKNYFVGGVQEPKYLEELTLDIYEDMTFDMEKETFRNNRKFVLEISGSNRSLYELGKYLINISLYETMDPDFHEHFDGLFDSQKNEKVNLIVRKQIDENHKGEE